MTFSGPFPSVSFSVSFSGPNFGSGTFSGVSSFSGTFSGTFSFGCSFCLFRGVPNPSALRFSYRRGQAQ